MKTIITFGSKHLEWLHHRLNPMNVALVVEADIEEEYPQAIRKKNASYCINTFQVKII